MLNLHCDKCNKELDEPGAYVGNKLAQEPQKEPHVIIKCLSLDGNHCYIEGKQIGKAEYASSQGFSKIYDSWSILEGGVNKIVIEVGK